MSWRCEEVGGGDLDLVETGKVKDDGHQDEYMPLGEPTERRTGELGWNQVEVEGVLVIDGDGMSRVWCCGRLHNVVFYFG